jgi:hypothetical protein
MKSCGDLSNWMRGTRWSSFIRVCVDVYKLYLYVNDRPSCIRSADSQSFQVQQTSLQIDFYNMYKRKLTKCWHCLTRSYNQWKNGLCRDVFFYLQEKDIWLFKLSMCYVIYDGTVQHNAKWWRVSGSGKWLYSRNCFWWPHFNSITRPKFPFF